MALPCESQHELRVLCSRLGALENRTLLKASRVTQVFVAIAIIHVHVIECDTGNPKGRCYEAYSTSAGNLGLETSPPESL